MGIDTEILVFQIFDSCQNLDDSQIMLYKILFVFSCCFKINDLCSFLLVPYECDNNDLV